MTGDTSAARAGTERTHDAELRARLRDVHRAVLTDPDGILPHVHDPRLSFPYAVIQLGLVIERARAQCRRLYPATPQERLALGTTWDLGPLTMSELARHTSLSLPATSALVDRLVTRGFLKRAPDESDRRRTLVSVTPLAMTSMDGPVFEIMARLVEALEGFEDRELEVVHRALGTSYGVIDEMVRKLATYDDDELRAESDAWSAAHGPLELPQDGG